MNVDFEYKPGLLKCEDCAFYDNCKASGSHCVANVLGPSGVMHYVICEKGPNKELRIEIIQLLLELNNK